LKSRLINTSLGIVAIAEVFGSLVLTIVVVSSLKSRSVRLGDLETVISVISIVVLRVDLSGVRLALHGAGLEFLRKLKLNKLSGLSTLIIVNNVVKLFVRVIKVVLRLRKTNTRRSLMLLQFGVLGKSFAAGSVLTNEESLTIVFSHVIVKRIFISEGLIAAINGAFERKLTSVDSDVILQGVGSLEELAATIRARQVLLLLMVHLVLVEGILVAEDLGATLMSAREVALIIGRVLNSGALLSHIIVILIEVHYLKNSLYVVVR